MSNGKQTSFHFISNGFVYKLLPITMPGKTPTFCKRVRIVLAVFKPEAVTELEVVKLSGQDARERRSKHCSGE